MSSKHNRRGRRRSRHEHRPDEGRSLETLFFGDTGLSRTHGPGHKRNTKTLQLCRQVHRRLDMVLGADLNDPVLQGLWIHAVVPEPGGTSLLVEVVVPDAALAAPVLTHLHAARGHLRAEIAAAIHRKRTPHLQFVVVPAAALAGAFDEGATPIDND